MIARTALAPAVTSSGSSRSAVTSPGVWEMADWPLTTFPAITASRLSRRGAAGMTEPMVPSSHSHSASAASNPPWVSARAAMIRLPSEWPSTSAPSNRYSNRLRQCDSSGVRARRQRRMSPGGGMSSAGASLPEEPPSSATVTTAAIEAA